MSLLNEEAPPHLLPSPCERQELRENLRTPPNHHIGDAGETMPAIGVITETLLTRIKRKFGSIHGGGPRFCFMHVFSFIILAGFIRNGGLG